MCSSDLTTGERDTVFAQYRKWVEKEGAEGVVVRSPSAGLFKIKPRHSLDLAVVGFSEGIDDRANVLLLDYRDIPTLGKSFDRIASIEMLEAVGDAFLETYFSIVQRVLRPGGVFGAQFITCPDSRYDQMQIGRAHV